MPFKPALNEQERWARSLADMTAGTEMALYLIQNLVALVLTLLALRGMLPAKGRIDWAVLVMAVLIQVLILLGIAWVIGEQWSVPNPLILVGWGIIGVLGLLTNLTFFVLIAMIIVSWVAAGSRHPAIELIGQIADPIMTPFRALLPNMGGIDFSPILLFVTINIVQIGLRHAAVALSLPPNLVVGL